MSSLSRWLLPAPAFVLIALMIAQKTPPKSPPPKPPAARPAPKSALDKAVLEAYVRHLFVWGPHIQVRIADPVPSSQLPGFFDVVVTGSAGNASQQETFLISPDGQKILRAMVFDVQDNPFRADLAKLKTDFQPSMGTPGAPVVLVQFSDFQCPFCKEEARILRENLLKTYPSQVRLYFKDFPLEQIHPWAKSASIAARCIFRQNAPVFWDFYDWIYAHQQEITADNLKAKVLEYAQGKPLDSLQLARCIDTRATAAEVERNSAEARSLGLNSIPTLFVNGRRLVGQVAWANLKQIIDFEIDYQKTARNAGDADPCCQLPPLSPAPKIGP